MLELNNNNLKQIHSSAFIPIQSSIYELNLSNNNKLTSIPLLGLEQLISLKAYGNEQLRRLPFFRSARSLALTYAYHCCDYLANNNDNNGDNSSGGFSNKTAELPLVVQLIDSILVKLRKLFNHHSEDQSDSSSTQFMTDQQQQPYSELAKGGEDSHLNRVGESSFDVTNSDNFTELVIWPQVGGSKLDLNEIRINERRQKRHKQHLHHHHNHHRNHYHSQRHTDQYEYSSWQDESAVTGSEKDNPPEDANNGHLMDSSDVSILMFQVRQIRIAHNVLVPFEIDQFDMMQTDEDNRFFSLASGSKHVSSSSDGRRQKRHYSHSDKRAFTTQQATNLEEPLLMDGTTRRDQANSVIVVVKCLPKPNAFFPCQDLFDTWWLRFGIWSVFLLAFTGNILVIVVLSLVRPSSATSALTSIMWLAHSKRHIDVPRFLVINLAIADLLMAIYLGLLAFVDLSTLGEFKLFAIKWQYSSGCKLAGFLGVLSSELSVFILAIITLERNYAITNAVHLNRRLSLQKAMIIMLVGYTFALSMAIMPLNGISDYRKFSICLPLNIDSNLSSQIYIISLISINTFSFLLLLSCYLRMYFAIRGSQAWNTNDLRIVKRMSILVITDFLCWMPIIIVSIATLFGYHIIGTNGIKILTIFILPLNSVANPFLYAITTKKFKRDLNTLIRRTRSGINRLSVCHKGTDRLEDPKAFIGNYNEYQHNLMLHYKKQNKNFLANEFIKNQQKQQKQKEKLALNKRKYNKEFRNDRNDKFNYQMSTRPFGHNTANQVTINRTSCSCQRNIQEREEELNNYQQASSSVVVQVNAHMKPKIVLDSVEADSLNEKIHESIENDCTLGKSSSNNLTMLSLKQENEKYLVLNDDCFNNNSKFQGQSREDKFFESSYYLRPKSDEICDRRQPVSCPIGSSCHAINNQFETSNSAHNDNKEPFITTNKQRNPNVLDITQQDQARSASACDYSTAAKKKTECHNRIGGTKVASTGAQNDPNSIEAKVCGSYDTIQGVKKGNNETNSTKRSSEKLSQSINRLLFNPIAKALSSIQISLSLSASHVAAMASGKQSSNRLDNQEEEQSATNTNTDTNTTTTTTPKKDTTTHNSTTIEDILLMSSPSTRPFINERRMSRSCDLVSQQNQICFVSPSSSMTGGTSQAEDDDQRILLATINRIAANRESAKRRIVTNNQQRYKNNNEYVDCDNFDFKDDEMIVHHNDCFNDIKLSNDIIINSDKKLSDNCRNQRKYSRSSKRFNRCRSWSPALLSKLEDCIHQIKFKIPGFISNNNGNNTRDELDEHNHYQEVVHESSTHDSSHVYSSCCNMNNDEPLINAENLHDNCCGDDDENYQVNDDEDEDDAKKEEREDDYDNDDLSDHGNSDDIFDERAIDEWNQRRKNVFKRRHAGRLSRFQHQSSTNSDTLSTRTGATLVTNMSISFDDANCANTSQVNLTTHQRLHSVGEVNETQTTTKQNNPN